MLVLGAILLCIAAAPRRTTVVVRGGWSPAPYSHPPVVYPRKQPTKAPKCAAAHTDGVEGCLHVQQACVDQGEVVMMSAEYIPDITHPR
jgi:hypothetical protein